MGDFYYSSHLHSRPQPLEPIIHAIPVLQVSPVSQLSLLFIPHLYGTLLGIGWRTIDPHELN